MGFHCRRSAGLGPLRFNVAKGGLSALYVGGDGSSFNIPVSRSGQGSQQGRPKVSPVGVGPPLQSRSSLSNHKVYALTLFTSMLFPRLDLVLKPSNARIRRATTVLKPGRYAAN
jgi:hypothetical protein